MPRLLAALLALALAAPAAAQDAPTTEPATLRITAEGTASAEPDMATIRIGVETQAPTPTEALQQNTAAVEQVTDRILAAGVPEKDIQTANFSVFPVYDHRRMEQEGTPPLIVGFRVSNEVVANIRDLDGIGQVLANVVEAGANQINSLSFGLEDDAPVRDKARREAVAEAKRLADLYAEAAGVQLERILSIEESFAMPPQPMGGRVMRMEAMDAAAPVPIQRGEASVTAHVTVVWEIAPAE